MTLIRQTGAAALLVAMAIGGAFAEDGAKGQSKKQTAPRAQINRGRYLVAIAGCSDCHTPWKLDPSLQIPVPDTSRLLSGHPENAPDPSGKWTANDFCVIGPTSTSFTLPFGVVYSANLTPDKDTGLGSWTEVMFINTLRKGRHMGGLKSARPVLPPMPIQDYRNMTSEDLKAVFAYLQSIPPIRNAVPNPKVSPEALQRLSEAQDKVEAKQTAHWSTQDPD